MAPSGSVAQAIASGTQDIAALAGLFCTSSVECNALATHLGYGNLAVSTLSLLGVLGMVKSALKISLGRERCRATGFSLDSIRGLFGYTALEAAANKKIVDCDIVTVKFGAREILIEKGKQYLSPESTPLVTVGSLWGAGPGGEGGRRLTGFTLMSLGNLESETAWSQNIWLHFFGSVCAGVTAWLLLVIDAPWNWVRIYATLGMHVSLVILFAIPLHFSWQTRRPGGQLTAAKWKALMGEEITGEKAVKRLNLLQCRVGNGDVLHAQGDTTFLQKWPLRVLTLLTSVVLVTAYICQYAVVTLASNKASAIWISCQAVAALVRVCYWIFSPKFGDTQPEKSPFAIVLNNASRTLTLAEVVCACGPGKTAIPRWVWEYLRAKDLDEVIREAGNRSAEDIVPVDAEWMVFTGHDFNRITRARIPGALSGHTHHELYLGFWRAAKAADKGIVHPFFLVGTQFLWDGESTNCLMEAKSIRVYREAEWRIEKSCTVFALNQENGERLHLRSFDSLKACEPNCDWKGETTDRIKEATLEFLFDRSRMCDELVELANNKGFEQAKERAVIISAGAATADQ
ncbi:hypothetical protein FGG08_003113 [Glutinoglossum americanum]|uniref:Uncharacterized protein n=1 Tax=Glutinoglossum americanum TaxID=1670608 RepID=A0A9P8IBQ4_9PEZI|nr:hypothetical protein FGG08_003113 [Glutinoglossum americanum]